MMIARVALTVGLLFGSAACTPTPTPSAGGGGGGGGGVDTNCAFAPNQTTQDLRMTCTVSGSPPNRLLNPLSSGGGCNVVESLSLFGQSVSAGATFIYGENGDDNSGRVRIGVSIADGASHTGQIAKSAVDNCIGTLGPVVSVNTAFGGNHVAIVDKGQTPMCVFRSRFEPSTFNQTLGDGLEVDVSLVTRDATVDAIHRLLDIEAARAVNRLLAPSAALDAAFERRAGRCANDWRRFTD